MMNNYLPTDFYKTSSPHLIINVNFCKIGDNSITSKDRQRKEREKTILQLIKKWEKCVTFWKVKTL